MSIIDIENLSRIKDLISKRLFIQIQYFNEFHEFHTLQSIIKNTDGDHIEMVNGVKIDISSIASINGNFLSGYQHMEDFTCDC